ncbi:MAG: nitroreductase family protein [Oscillospiraceae bacterium]|jgi:nitroreductase|nr:nitroreductase family protein [Oscillospiraceae bacterium]
MPANETLGAITSRRSTRAYKPDPIPEDILSDILKAGQAAPYVAPDSRRFSVLRDRRLITRLSEAAKEQGIKLGDFQREMFSAPGFDGTYGAPVVVILSGNPETVQYEAVCAASVQNMLIAAQSLGVASCWAYFPVFAFHGTDAEAWRTELRIPQEYRPCAAVLLGYAAAEPYAQAGERYRNAVDYV